MDNWDFIDHEGVFITQGWQGTKTQAREQAEAYARRSAAPVAFMESGEDVNGSETVFPKD